MDMDVDGEEESRGEKRGRGREREREEEGSLFQKSMVNFPSRKAPDLVRFQHVILAFLFLCHQEYRKNLM